MRSTLKKLFAAFWRRNLTFSKLAIVTNLQYRFNFFIDAYLQPTIQIAIESMLWLALFKLSNNTTIGGFDKNMYLAYVTWAPFLSRIGISWMYEFIMINEVSSGNLNIVLSRPISFYEYYLSQFMGYKILTTSASLIIPLGFSYFFNLPIQYDRIPLALLLIFCYLFLVHNLSFIISSLGFFLTKVGSLTIAKNLTLMFLAGDLIPIDLFPKELSKIILWLPFASSVYIPAGFISGRCDINLVWQGFASVFISLGVTSVICRALWKKGLLEYTGTGA